MINEEITTKQLEWIPIGNQAEKYQDNPLKPVFEDILIAKMRPGQEIEAEMFCEKGTGQTHAKWSPVATAYYRLVPKINFKEDIYGEEAEKIMEKCPTGVFNIEDIGGKKKLIVQDERKCSTCRECLRDTEDKVILTKAKNHYECILILFVKKNLVHVESVGILPPEEIFMRAITVLKEKANDWLIAFSSA